MVVVWAVKRSKSRFQGWCQNICYTLSQTNSQSKQHQFVPFLLPQLVVRIPLWDQMITFPISNNWFVQFMEAIRGGCYLRAPGYNVNIVTVSWICINFIIVTVSAHPKSFNSSHVFQGDLASISPFFRNFNLLSWQFLEYIFIMLPKFLVQQL